MNRSLLLATSLAACVPAPTFMGIEGDAGSDDAMTVGMARVRVQDRTGAGTPKADALVVSVGPDGTTSEAQTDAAGMATIEVSAGGTLYVADSIARTLVAILDVAPDETYDVGAVAMAVPVPPIVTLTYKPPAGAALYTARARCGGGMVAGATATISFVYDSRCAPTERVGIATIARDTSDALIGLQFTEVMFGLGFDTSTDFTPGKPVTVTLDGTDGLTTEPAVSAAMLDQGEPLLAERIDKPTLTTPSQRVFTGAYLDGGDPQHEITIVLSDTARTVTLAERVDRGPTYARDVSVRPPFLGPVDASLHWSATLGDAQLTLLDQRIAPVNAGVDDITKIRYLMKTPPAPSFTAPPLPASLAAFRANPGDAVVSRVRYVLLEGSAPPTWPDVRQRIDYLLPDISTTAPLFALPGVTRVGISRSP